MLQTLLYTFPVTQWYFVKRLAFTVAGPRRTYTDFPFNFIREE